MEPLRCWSRWDGTTDQGAESLYCEADAGHDKDSYCHARHGAYMWERQDCAPDHGPTGRLSVAHRLRELSWRADMIDFRLRRRTDVPDTLGAIAARLLAGISAAMDDLLVLESRRASRFLMRVEFPSEVADAIDEILRAAADLLRPFAEGV